MEIRSFRAVFDLERRIYRVDRLRLNPGGVPVRGVVYFLALLAACLLLGRLPLLGALAAVFPWYIVDLALPAGSAALLTVIRIDGRPFHLAARSLARYRFGAAQPAGLCAPRVGTRMSRGGVGRHWLPEDLLILPDGSDGRMRRLLYTGPGAVLVTVPHACDGRSVDRRRVGGRLARRRALGRADVRLRELQDPDGPRSDHRRAPAVGQGGGTVIALAAKARLKVG